MNLISFIADKRKICRENNKDEGVVHMILSHIYGLEPSSLYLRYYQDIDEINITLFETYFSPYITNSYPIQYLMGYTYFYGLKLEVNSNVLIPRSETEELVDRFIKDHKEYTIPLVVADIGTGSGAIALSVKSNRNQDRIIASDISSAALEVAKRNAKNLNLEVEFIQGNLLDKLIEKNIKIDVILSNPPYIDENDNDVAEIVRKYEPSIALFAKQEGLACYIEILNKCKEVLNPFGKIYFEIGYKQKESIINMVNAMYPSANVVCYKDIYDNDRIIKIVFND